MKGRPKTHTYVTSLMVVLTLLLIYDPIVFGIKKQTDKQRKLASKSSSVTALPSSQKRYALIIGVDQYEDTQINRLEGASNDAKALAEALVRYAGFPNDQVILLAGDQSNERRPIRGNILRRLSNLCSSVPKDGLLLVSFAGHGMERDGRAYLLPTDAQISGDIALLEATAIPVEIVRNWIRESGVGQVIIILDACRNNPEAGRGDNSQSLSKAYTIGFNFDTLNSEITAFVTLYATEVGQMAYEYKERKQGYFTWALVDGLKGEAANNKGEVTLASLVNYLQEAVPKRISMDLGAGKKQRPYVVIEGYRPEELVIAKTDRPPLVAPKIETADQYIRKGDTLASEEKWVAAEAEYRSALKLGPNTAQSRFKLAEALFNQERWAEAEAEYRQAVNLEPSRAIWHSGLGVALQKQDKWAEAETEYRQAIRLEPNNAAWHNQVGFALAFQQKWAEAEIEFTNAVKLDPNIAAIHYNLARTLIEQQKWPNAEAEASEAVRLDKVNKRYQELLKYIRAASTVPTPSTSAGGNDSNIQPSGSSAMSANQHKNAGDTFKNAGKLEEAEKEYRQAVQMEPKNLQWRNDLAGTLYNLQKWAEAELQLQEALTIDPNNFLWHANLGMILCREGKWVEGEAQYREAARLQPTKALWRTRVGLALMEQKKFSKAEEEFKAAVEMEPNAALYHYQLGMALYKQEKWEKAEAVLRQAVRLDPKQADWYNLLGNTLFNRQKWKDSIDEYRQAIRLKPDAAWVHDNLSVALRKMRWWAEAEAEGREAVRLDPTNSKYKENLRRVLEKNSQ